jgi:hypothetical protein
MDRMLDKIMIFVNMLKNKQNVLIFLGIEKENNKLFNVLLIFGMD